MRKVSQAAIFVVVCSWASIVAGQSVLREAFEGADPSWRDAGGDATYKLDLHDRVQEGAHGGQFCERVRLSGQNGSYVYLSHEIAPSLIIGELVPSVWIKADRPGMQIMVRAVLPRTKDARTGQPLTTYLRGSGYTQAGNWQQLRVEQATQALERQLRVLRAAGQRDADGHEAYIDRVMLNVYGGPGTTTVLIDDLEVTGFVGRQPRVQKTSTHPRSSSGDAAFERLPSPDDVATRPASTAADVRLNSGTLLVDGKPFFPRAIEHRGESLARLQALGFNTVRLSAPPPAALLREARALGLWLIAPPPSSRELEARRGAKLDAAYDPVLAWDLGQELSTRELEPLKRWARSVRTSDPRNRPLVCDPDSELRAYSRQVDVFFAHRGPLGSSLDLNDYGTWLRERPQLARPGTPVWAAIPSQPAPRLLEQLRLLSGNAALDPMWQHQQVRLLVLTALASGVRGLSVQSSSSLEASDPQTRLRAASLELINLELDLIEPWCAAGSFVTTASSFPNNVGAGLGYNKKAAAAANQKAAANAANVAKKVPGYDGLGGQASGFGDMTSKFGNNGGGAASNLGGGLGAGGLNRNNPATMGVGGDIEAVAAVMQSERARLLMPLAMGPNNQFVLFPPPGTSTPYIVPGVPDSNDAYELSPGGLHSLAHKRVSGGIRVPLNEVQRGSLVVLTQDPLVISNLTRRTDKVRKRSAELVHELARQHLAAVEETNRRLDAQGHAPAPVGIWLETARLSCQECEKLLATGDQAGALTQARKTEHALQQVERASWEKLSPALVKMAPFKAAGSTVAAPMPLASLASKRDTSAILGVPTAVPLAVCYQTLPEYWTFAADLPTARRSENRLPAGDFEDLANMLQSGWRHFQHAEPGVTTEVQLTAEAPHSGRLALRLKAAPAQSDQQPGLVETPPLWITSPPLGVDSGQLLCIHGWVKVPVPITGSVDGLEIIDSLGGELLAQRVRTTTGWQEFNCYRVAPRSGTLVVTFALTGLGEAWVDDVTIQVVERLPPGSTTQAAQMQNSFVPPMR